MADVSQSETSAEITDELVEKLWLAETRDAIRRTLREWVGANGEGRDGR